MNTNINFIGIGAQKCATSWVYACLYEHPEVCIPVKEIHFFSRDRFQKGKEWYEKHFTSCKKGLINGEFSTSYLYSPEAPKRIHSFYPNSKLIVVLREPAARAYSQYTNAIKAGEISKDILFNDYLRNEQSCIEQGLYTTQIERYLSIFSSKQILILFFEDIEDNALNFIQKIYTHIGVDSTFIPPSLTKKINTARIPKNTTLDKIMHVSAEFLREYGAGLIT